MKHVILESCLNGKCLRTVMLPENMHLTFPEQNANNEANWIVRPLEGIQQSYHPEKWHVSCWASADWHDTHAPLPLAKHASTKCR